MTGGDAGPQDKPERPARPATPVAASGVALEQVAALAPLLAVPRWCCWRWSWRAWVRKGEAGGAWTKVPWFAAGVGDGEPLSAKHPEHGKRYAVARDMVLRGDANGVGWIVTGETEWVWLDLDKCRDADTGAVAPWAQAVLERVRAIGAYTEISPSGAGMRVLMRAGLDAPMQGRVDMPRLLAGLDEDGLAAWGGSRECHKLAGIEIFYACVRYVTMTGRDAAGVPDGDGGGLAMALWQLGELQRGAARKGRASKAAPGEDKRAPIEDVVSALSVINNDDGWDVPASWEEWNRIGMAVFAATGGAPEGLEAWMAWSARSKLKHDPAACEERWAHWTSSSPPTGIGFGALAIAAGEATRGRWRRPSRAPEVEFEHEEDPGEKEGRREGEEEGEKVPALLTRLGERMVYVLSLRRFFDLQEKHLIGAEQLAAVASDMGIPLFGASGKKSIAALLLNRRLVRHVHGVTMRPGREQIIEDITAEGLLRPMVNRWTPSALVPVEGDPAPWLEHARRLIPDADDFERTIKRQAWILQNPGKKINHALVLVGDQGAGKDSFLKPFFDAIGSHNVAPVKGSMIGGEFNGYLLRSLVFVIEMPPAHKRDVYEEIKGWLTKPPDQVMINEKMIPAYPIPNDANTIISTNHEGAIALSLDDRRIDVVATQFAIEGEAAEVYYTDLYRWLGQGGSAIVMGWLLRQDVSAFNPHAPPPRTQAKLEMMRHGAHPAVDWAMTLWEHGGVLSNRELVAMNEIMDMGRHQRGFGASHLVAIGITPQRIVIALRLGGWQFVQRVRVEGVLQSVWGRGPVGLLRQLPPVSLAARLIADRQGANAF